MSTERAAEDDGGRAGATADGGVAIERRSPEATFALLGDDIRMGILRALGGTPDGALSFGDLREAAGVRDSGQFNYHLGKLVGTFVRKTEAGYELTYAGRQVVGATYAGTYTASATVEPFPAGGDCPLCGGDVLVEYADETVRMDCTDCEEWYNSFSFPPGSLEGYDREELPGAFDRWLGHVFRGILAGFCPTCAGRMDGRLVADDPGEFLAGIPAHAEYECRRCGGTATAAGATPALYHPGVEGFLFDHGFDSTVDHSWTLGSAVAVPEGELVSTDPPRLAVTITHDGETVAAVVEDDATVGSVERRPAAGSD